MTNTKASNGKAEELADSPLKTHKLTAPIFGNVLTKYGIFSWLAAINILGTRIEEQE